MSENKRRFLRANYPCSITVWRQDGLADIILANTANISPGGACIHVYQRINPGTTVDVKIEFLHNKAMPFVCHAKVLRCDLVIDQNKGKDFYKIGIQFCSVDDETTARLQDIVAELIKIEQRNK